MTQVLLRVSSYPLFISVVLLNVFVCEQLEGAVGLLRTVDEAHIVAERGRGAALHADNEICATLLPTNVVLCALVHDDSPCIAMITVALTERELHQSVALNVAGSNDGRGARL